MLDTQTADLKTVIDNKEQINQKLDTAVDDGVSNLVQLDDNYNIVVNKDAAIQGFLGSLYSSFDILSDQDEIQKLNLYIPVIIITVDDGYYIYYCDTYEGADGKTYLTKRWSEKFPFSFEDEDFIYGFTLGDEVRLYDKNDILDPDSDQTVFHLDYHDFQTKEELTGFREQRHNSILQSEKAFNSVKKSVIMNCIENTMAYYTSRHNNIASIYGITYNFSLPSVKQEEWDQYLETNSMFVVFQGYPYGNKSGKTYNRIASAAAKISKNNVYYLEQEGWYLEYHKSTCPELKKNGVIIYSDEPYYNVQDCAAAGAYACPYCSDTGVFAPDYDGK